MGTSRDRPFVILSGLPGSGKTSVARLLAPRIGLPLIDKDDILEQLFASKGIGDAAWRRQLSRESDAMLQSAVEASDGAVVSSFWHVAGMSPDSGTPTEWIEGLSTAIVIVHCDCAPRIAADRFVRRGRHPGHLDATRTDAEVLDSIEALMPFGPLALGEQIIVDTTGTVQAERLVRDVEAALARRRAQTGQSGHRR